MFVLIGTVKSVIAFIYSHKPYMLQWLHYYIIVVILVMVYLIIFD